MRSKEESARELGAELQRLLDSERSGAPLEQWYAKSLALQRNMRTDADFCDMVPNFVWDWLAGADVRKKEPEVAAEEGADIEAVIEQLSRGIWPE